MLIGNLHLLIRFQQMKKEDQHVLKQFQQMKK